MKKDLFVVLVTIALLIAAVVAACQKTAAPEIPAVPPASVTAGPGRRPC